MECQECRKGVHLDRPKFLDFDEAALTGWRDHPVSAALVEWLAWEADQCNFSCAALLRQGEVRKATAAAGKAEAWQEALSHCYRKDKPPEEAEAPFVDPAYRFSPDKAPFDEGNE